jgi:hypothetical protein
LTKTGISDTLIVKEIVNTMIRRLDSFDNWLELGVKHGWITEPFCHTHDTDPGMPEEEQKEWEDGGDPCQIVTRIMVY